MTSFQLLSSFISLEFCFFITGTVTDLHFAPSPSAVPEVLKSPSVHDLQVYGLIFTIILCLIVFGGVKIINRVSPAFLIPVILSLFFIYIGIFAARRPSDPCMFSHLISLSLSTHISLEYYWHLAYWQNQWSLSIGRTHCPPTFTFVPSHVCLSQRWCRCALSIDFLIWFFLSMTIRYWSAIEDTILVCPRVASVTDFCIYC